MICSQHHQEEKTAGIFCPGLRRGDAPLLTHTSEVENNNLNTSNNDNVILNSNLPPINIQKDSPFNTLIDLQK